MASPPRQRIYPELAPGGDTLEFEDIKNLADHTYIRWGLRWALYSCFCVSVRLNLCPFRKGTSNLTFLLIDSSYATF